MIPARVSIPIGGDLMALKACLLLVVAGMAAAQTYTATVRGVVTDASGAVVAGAAVTLHNIEQNRSWTYATNPNGEYVLVQVPPGSYSLTVKAAGFKTYQRTGLTLEVAQAVEI